MCSAVFNQALRGKRYDYNIKKKKERNQPHSNVYIIILWFGLCVTVVVARGSHSLVHSRTVFRELRRIFIVHAFYVFIIIIIAIIMILLLSLLFRLSRTTLILWLIC